MRALVLLTLSFLATLAPVAFPRAHATPSPVFIAFLRNGNVMVTQADGRGGHQLTFDGTGTAMVRGKEITYGYLTWSPDRTRLLVARHVTINPSRGKLQDDWQVEVWSPGGRLVPLVGNISGVDFDPQWSADSRSVAYMAQSSYDDHTTMFHNLVDMVGLQGTVSPLVRFEAHEGCMTTSTDPSELTLWDQIGYGGVRQTFLWSSQRHFLIYSKLCIHTGLTYLNLRAGLARTVGESMTEAALSPNQQQLVGVEGRGLVLSHPNGTAKRAIALTAGAELPTWAPNGRSIYFVLRRTVRTLHYHDQAGNLFEILVNHSAIKRVDLTSGRVSTIFQAPIHGFANLAFSPDGKWLYFTQVTNSDALYRHLIGQPHVTDAALQRYGPKIAVMRIPSSGGTVQSVALDAGQVTVP